jgi:hypothetical protein
MKDLALRLLMALTSEENVLNRGKITQAMDEYTKGHEAEAEAVLLQLNKRRNDGRPCQTN